jgi:hypothetical protein
LLLSLRAMRPLFLLAVTMSESPLVILQAAGRFKLPPGRRILNV